MGTSGLVLSAGLCISDFFFLSFCAAAGEAQANTSVAMMAADSATRNMREVSRVVNRVFIPRKTPFGRIDFSRELLEDSTAIFGRGACVQLVYLRFSSTYDFRLRQLSKFARGFSLFRARRSTNL